MVAIGAILIAFAIWPRLAGAAGYPEALVKIMGLTNDDQVSLVDEDDDDISKLRPRSIRNAGRTLGIQAGASYQHDLIVKTYQEKASSLDRIANFKMLLMYGNRVLPPVIVTASASRKIESNNMSVETGRSYRIVKEARFVGNPPSWRDYLMSNVFKVGKVHPKVLPEKDYSKEISIWRKACVEGWAIGVEQARRVHVQKIREMERDVIGMVRFSELEKQGLVSLPSIREGRYAIKVGDKTLDINQKTFRIDRKAHFQSADKWRVFQ